MQKIILFFISILFISDTIEAQSNTSFFVGANGAWNYILVANQMNYGQKEMKYDENTTKTAFGGHLGYDFNGVSQLSLGFGFLQNGQFYSDKYSSGASLEKEIILKYFSVPLSYRFIFGGNKNPHQGTKFSIIVGAQLDFLSNAEVKHKINGSSASLMDFATYDTDGTFVNANAATLITLTGTNESPNNDKELFNETDLKAFLGFGIISYFTEHLFLTADLKVAGSIQDINAEKWRFNGFSDGKIQNYEASRNVNGSFQIGLNYRF